MQHQFLLTPTVCSQFLFLCKQQPSTHNFSIHFTAHSFKHVECFSYICLWIIYMTMMGSVKQSWTLTSCKIVQPGAWTYIVASLMQLCFINLIVWSTRAAWLIVWFSFLAHRLGTGRQLHRVTKRRGRRCTLFESETFNLLEVLRYV